jgi:hypothetical protein
MIAKINTQIDFSDLEEEDLIQELEERGFEVLKIRTLRDEELYDLFLQAKEKFTYGELIERLSC